MLYNHYLYFLFLAGQIIAYPGNTKHRLVARDDCSSPANCQATDLEVWRNILTDDAVKGNDEFKNMKEQIATIPKRPDGVDPASFHASQFEFFDDIIRKYGVNPINPAAVHVPVFLYGRTGPTVDPCYPEGGTNAQGSGPNPGTGTPSSFNPGQNCMNPSDDKYKGGKYTPCAHWTSLTTTAYTPGRAFPVYIGAKYCNGEWRVNYDVYYVHDGNLSAGHKHDWEGVTVVFRPDPNHTQENWYQAAAVIFNRHKDHDHYDWKDVQTIFGNDDVREETFGAMKKHPKVYVGFWSHSAFRDKCDSSNNCPTVNTGEPNSKKEYRSHDWYRLPDQRDLTLWDAIHGDWNYGSATSTPTFNHNNMCGY